MALLKTHTGIKNLSISRILRFFFLVLYFFGGPPSDFVHVVSHPREEHGFHKGEYEQGSSLHHDVPPGCEHDAHILAKEHCYRCYCNPHHDLLLPGLINVEFFKTSSSGFHCYTMRAGSAVALVMPARAPPVLL